MAFNRCPCCGSDLNLAVSKHALERLEDRIYLKYFRRAGFGESKEKWLFQYALEALEKGFCYPKASTGVFGQWYKNTMFIFKNHGSSVILLTIYPCPQPKKRQGLITPKEVSELIGKDKND